MFMQQLDSRLVTLFSCVLHVVFLTFLFCIFTSVIMLYTSLRLRIVNIVIFGVWLFAVYSFFPISCFLFFFLSVVALVH